jgi:peptide/nickel transport system substrate-binding protein
MTVFRAGFAEVCITPALGLPTAGMPNAQPATGVHWPLHGRVVVLEADGRRAAIVALDLAALMPEIDRDLRAALARAGGLEPREIVTSCTHTHSAPQAIFGLVRAPDAGYLQLVEERLTQATACAVAALEPVELRVGAAPTESVTFNRRPVYRGDEVGTHGPMWVDDFVRLEGPADEQLQLLLAVRAARRAAVELDSKTMTSPERSLRAAGRSGPLPVVAALALCALVAVLVSTASAADVAAKPVLRIASVDPVTLDPFAWGGNQIYSNGWVYQAPLHWNLDDSFGPSLATSWRWVKGPANSLQAHKILEFTLRHNARFSDGTPVTAKAIKLWYDYLIGYGRKQYGANGEQFIFGVPLRSVTTVGRWKVVVHTKSPAPRLPESLSYGVSGPASPRCARDPGLLTKIPCGAGPYMVDFADTVAGDHMTLVPNPHYYDKSKQRWGKIYVKTISIASSSLQAMEAGEFDFAYGDPSTAKAAAAAGFTVVAGPNYNDVIIPDYKKVPALQDVRVRQALNYAIDRKALSNASGHGYALATSAIASIDGLSPKAIDYYSYNPARAKALLAAAGHSDDVTFSVLSYGPWGSVGTPLLQAVAQYYAAVGVKMNVIVGDAAGSLFGKTDALTGPFGFGSMWGVYTLYMQPGGGFNGLYGGGFDDRVADKLWVKGSRADNPIPYWKAITLRATEQAYWVPLLMVDSIYYENPKVVKGGAVAKIGGRPSLLADELVPAKS